MHYQRHALLRLGGRAPRRQNLSRRQQLERKQAEQVGKRMSFGTLVAPPVQKSLLQPEDRQTHPYVRMML
jgi:hypothetical protein